MGSPKEYGFFSRNFGLKMDIDFDQFGLKWGVFFMTINLLI